MRNARTSPPSDLTARPFLDWSRQVTRAQGNEEAAKIDAQKEAEARVRRAEIAAEATK